MSRHQYTVTFSSLDKTVRVAPDTTLLEAAARAGIVFDNLCGGTGTCRHCKMIITRGDISREATQGLSPEESRQGMVLACLTEVKSDLTVDIPPGTFRSVTGEGEADMGRFQDQSSAADRDGLTPPKHPLVDTIFIECSPPTLNDHAADHQRLVDAACQKTGAAAVNINLPLLQKLPQLLREHDWRITATVARQGDTVDVIDIDGGHRAEGIYMAVIDIGTTTIVAELIDCRSGEAIGRQACFNSQSIYGSEITARMIAAEKMGASKLHSILIRDLNDIIGKLAAKGGIHLDDIRAVICAGNTVMIHFLLGLPTRNIRRTPYIAAAIAPPVIRAAEIGIRIRPGGLIYALPGIGSWVGSDITAGILATGMHEKEEISLLMDIGTNGEIVIGNREWLVATSASAGPALEGASIECGMRAEAGAIEAVFLRDNQINFRTIENMSPRGICGSGIIDLLSSLLKLEVIDRSGKFINPQVNRIIGPEGGSCRYILHGASQPGGTDTIFISEADIENIITAKAAIFAAMKILLKRLDLKFSDINRFYIAGAFGHHIDIESAATIGLIPRLPGEKIEFAGNTSLTGARAASLCRDHFDRLRQISRNTTYYDLMGAADYVEEFRKALFLPHTDIEEFEQEVTSP